MTAILKQQVMSCWVQQIWCVEQMHFFFNSPLSFPNIQHLGQKQKTKDAVLLMNVSK